MGEGLLTNDRWERRGGGPQRLIICCEPSSPWPLSPQSYAGNESLFFWNAPACLCPCFGFDAINQKWWHAKAVTTFMVMSQVPMGTIPTFFTCNVLGYYSLCKEKGVIKWAVIRQATMNWSVFFPLLCLCCSLESWNSKRFHYPIVSPMQLATESPGNKAPRSLFWALF